MTKRQFEKLKKGDVVVLNGQCRKDVGVKCVVTYICDDRIWVKPIVGQLKAEHSLKDFNEIAYTAANIV